MGGSLIREIEYSVAEACSTPCLGEVCRELKSLVALLRSGGRMAATAARGLARLIPNAADYALAAGCTDEAMALNRAVSAARALASLAR